VQTKKPLFVLKPDLQSAMVGQFLKSMILFFILTSIISGTILFVSKNTLGALLSLILLMTVIFFL